MVTNTELQELVRNIEAFVGVRDGHGTDPTFLDLLTQINGLRREFEAFPTELNQYRVDVEDQLLEGLNFRKAAALQIDGLLKEDKNLHAEVKVLRMTVAASKPTGGDVSKLKFPEPKYFSGTRSSKELENFIWDVEQYFKTSRIAEDDKLNIASMYLSSDAKLWWRSRNLDDESVGQPRIDTWAKLKKEMRVQFLTSNAS